LITIGFDNQGGGLVISIPQLHKDNSSPAMVINATWINAALCRTFSTLEELKALNGCQYMKAGVFMPGTLVYPPALDIR
jgi:hypothetical protein